MPPAISETSGTARRSARRVLTLNIAVIAIASGLLAACGGSREAQTPVDVSPPGPEPTPVPVDVPRVMGYHAYWTNDAWQGYPYDVLDAVFFFEIEVGADGGLSNRHGWPDRWLPMQRHAESRGTNVIPVVSLMNADAFRGVFTTEPAQQRLHEEILALFADNPGIAGVHLDFEVFQRMPEGVRDAVTRFVQRLEEAMDRAAPGKSLSMFLLAYDEADVFDEAALAAVSDFVVVQGYDLHARSDEQAGPVGATDGWGRRSWRYVIDRYVDLGVPLEKIVMAVPYFGYEWPTASDSLRSRTRGPGRSITLAPVDSAYGGASRVPARLRAAEHGLQRDPVSGVPYYVYSDSTGSYQGWFEDEESLAAKYRFVQENGLRGVAIFPLAYGDEQAAEPLRRAFLLP